MGRANVLISALRSRRVRSRVLGINRTIRSIGTPGELSDPNAQENSGNLIQKFFRGTLSTAGWIIGTIGKIGGLARKIVDWGIRTHEYFYNFNWNITDAELDRSIASLKLRIAGQLGATFGNLVGYIACGVIPSIGIMVFNEPLALYLLNEVGEEALDELLGNLRVLLRTSIYGLLQASWITMYKSTRRWTKAYFKDPNSSQSKFAKKIFGPGFDHAVKTWGAEGSKPWSFAINAENRRDAIKDPLEREFWEEYDEEFGDACRDALYVLADGIDHWVLQQRLQEQARVDASNVIEITPNRQAEDERILVAGTDAEVRTQVMQIMNTHRLIDNRDVGMWVGEPLRTHVRKRISPLSVRVQLFNWPTPPFYRGAGNTTPVTCTIPGVKRSALDWTKIKEAFGGNLGYMWGRFWSIANLKDDDGDYAGQLQIYGGSANEAQRRLERILELTEYSVLTLTHGEEDESRSNDTNRRKYKEATRIHPAFMTIINKQKVAREDQGINSLQGTYKRTSDKIILWTDDKPSDFEETVQRLLRTTPN